MHSSARKERKPEHEASVKIKAQDLVCIVCLEYPPTEVLQCLRGHLLCNNCWKSLEISAGRKPATCPVCRDVLPRLEKAPRNLPIQNMLQTRKRCKNSASGCGDKLPLSQQAAHLLICQFENLPCTAPGCAWRGLRQMLPSHLVRCKARTVAPKTFHVPAAAASRVVPVSVVESSEDSFSSSNDDASAEGTANGQEDEDDDDAYSDGDY